MAPVNAYAENVKPALEAIQSAVANINTQVKAIDEAETQKKLDEAAAYFEKTVPDDTRDFVSFEKLYGRHSEWKNKGATIEKVQSDIQVELAGIERDLAAIRAHDERYCAVMLDAYRERFSLTDALGKYASMKRTEELEKVRAEREAAARAAAERDAEERRQAAAKAMEVLESAERTEIHAAPENDEIKEAEPVQSEILVRDFRVWATREQLNGLGAWLKANGVRYGKVPKEGV
jgi:hypothetical protein